MLAWMVPSNFRQAMLAWMVLSKFRSAMLAWMFPSCKFRLDAAIQPAWKIFGKTLPFQSLVKNSQAMLEMVCLISKCWKCK
jgi:hypothetical protein